MSKPENHLQPFTLERYVTGDLPSAEKAGVERHLEQCSECAAAVSQLRDLQATLNAAGQRYRETRYPENAFAQIQTRLEELPQRRTWWRLAWVLPAAACVAFFLLWMGQGRHFPQQSGEYDILRARGISNLVNPWGLSPMDSLGSALSISMPPSCEIPSIDFSMPTCPSRLGFAQG